jgi:hypothetical protein
MNMLHISSLATTLDEVNNALFLEQKISQKETASVVRWLAGRQGLPQSYSGMFAPTAKDFAEGIKLFTGERITSAAATGHILGEEASRALLLLVSRSKQVRESLDRATAAMDDLLSRSETEVGRQGFF